MNKLHTQWRNCLLPLICASAMAALGGCASMNPQATPEDAVRVEAAEMIQLKRAGKFEQAYERTAPGYRAVVPFIRFQSDNVGVPAWHAGEVVNVQCDEPVKCEVKVRVEMKAPAKARFGQSNIETHIDETWILESGRWWLFPRL